MNDYDYWKDVVDFEKKYPGKTYPKVSLPNWMKKNSR